MRRWAFVLLLALLAAPRAHAFLETEEPFVPSASTACLRQLGPEIELLRATNPFYLRGDFMGTGRAALMVQVRRRAGKQAGVLFCAAGRAPVLFLPGFVSRFTSPDVTEKNFLAYDWEVFTRAEAMALLRRNRQAGAPVGEAVAMIWEDGIALLSFDGRRFRWVGGMQ